MLRAALVLVAACLGWSSPNAVALQNEQRVALVIGNSAYKNAPLKNPANDAADMAATLRGYGFKVIWRTNANQREMRNAIREFGNELRRAQVGLFYFAGHGVQVKGVNYLVPVGADIQNEADAEDFSVDASYVIRTMEEAQVKVSIAILDACRNNPFARSFRSATPGLAQMNAATGSIVAFSTAPGGVAEDGSGRNGIYTGNLLASLREGDTDILKVFQRTRAAVVKETNGKQTPWESTSLIGDFFFRPPVGGGSVISKPPVAPVATDASANDRAFWDSVKDTKNSDELKAYLQQFPGGLFVALAEARLTSLRSATSPLPSAQYLTGTLKKVSDTGTITIGFRETSIPFSYLDKDRRPIGYAIDLCMKVVDAIRAELKLPSLRIAYEPVGPSNRIQFLQNGIIDLECGSTTNSMQRQQQVSFGPTYFVINVTAAVKRRSGIQSIADLAGKTIDTTSGTSAIGLLKAYQPTRNAYFNEIYGKDHSESFLLMANDRSAAFIMDDILLAGQIANSGNADDYKILPDSLRQEPYSMMFRKDDPQFKALVDKTINNVMKSGEIERIYANWFTSSIPPNGINFNFPMTPVTRWAVSNPNDTGVR